jgi:hypothetical protein
VSEGEDGWRFHIGVDTDTDRRRLVQFMTSRTWWAIGHHGWRGWPGKWILSALLIGVAFGQVAWLEGASRDVVIALPAFSLAAAPWMVPATVWLSGRIWRRRLRRTHSSGWVIHWCEGPQGQLAIRSTHPKPAAAGKPARWPGADMFATGGAGGRLIAWLQHLADEDHAVLVFQTTQTQMVAYYQRAGFTLVSGPWLVLGHTVQLGRAVLEYPAPRLGDAGT